MRIARPAPYKLRASFPPPTFLEPLAAPCLGTRVRLGRTHLPGEQDHYAPLPRPAATEIVRGGWAPIRRTFEYPLPGTHGAAHVGVVGPAWSRTRAVRSRRGPPCVLDPLGQEQPGSGSGGRRGDGPGQNAGNPAAPPQTDLKAELRRGGGQGPAGDQPGMPRQRRSSAIERRDPHPDDGAPLPHGDCHGPRVPDSPSSTSIGEPMRRGRRLAIPVRPKSRGPMGRSGRSAPTPDRNRRGRPPGATCPSLGVRWSPRGPIGSPGGGRGDHETSVNW
jgi:hypothetical protein